MKGKKKGFWHIVEIVIVVLSIFVLLVQFSNTPRIEGEWTKNKLLIQGRDILYSLEKSGINWFDPVEVKQALDFVFNGTNIQYDLRIEKTIKSQIRVACFCNEDEYNITLKSLSSFWLNGRKINFTVFRYDPTNIFFSNLYDVTLIWDYPLAGKFGEVMQYLANDRGIVIIRDLQTTDFQNQDEKAVLEDIFSLAWNESITPTGSSMIFSPAITVEMFTYPLVRNFYGFPNSSGDNYQPVSYTHLTLPTKA